MLGGKVLNILVLAGFLFMTCLGTACADEVKIATIDLKKIMNYSMVGQATQRIMQSKIDELKKQFQPEQEKLQALEDEIKKKSSIWSEEMRAQKEQEFMALRQQFGMVSQAEVRNLENRIIAPVLEDITEITRDIAKKEGYTLVINNSAPGLISSNELIYAAESTDISEKVGRELDARVAAETDEGKGGQGETPVGPLRTE